MIRSTLTAALAALLIAPAAFAADDGGFGTQRFSNQAPSALSGEGSGSALATVESADPATIEPAAGTAEDEQDSPANTPDGASDPEAIADEVDAVEPPPAE